MLSRSFYIRCCGIWLCCFLYAIHSSAGIPYASPAIPWADSLGNHRAVIQVQQSTTAAWVKIPWRRRDAHPEKFRLLITDEKGAVMKNILRIHISPETGELLFEPRSGAGKYYVYYMPYHGRKNNGWFDGDYLPPEAAPDAVWLTKVQGARAAKDNATVLEIQSRTPFDSFYPMEVCATAAETQQLVKQSKNDWLVFSEDRKFPVRMPDHLPLRWFETNHQQGFKGTAHRNEYYTFQLALFAATKDLENVKITYSRFSDRLTCFNANGVHPDGSPFTKTIRVQKGNIQALWFGLDIPAETPLHSYDFTVTLQPLHGKAIVVPVNINVTDTLLADRGDSEPWRHSRLRWLNSTLGESAVITAPYMPLQHTGGQITTLLHQVQLNNSGYIAGIRNQQGIQLLHRPMQWIIETNDGRVLLPPATITWTQETPAALSWETHTANKQLSLTCKGSLEFDGHISYHTTVQANSDITIKDIRFEIPFNKTATPYFMGMGLPGEKTPPQYDWKWSGPQDSYWAGDYNIGLHCEWQGAAYTGPLLNLYHPAPPGSWYNGNLGGFRLRSNGEETVATQYTGVHTLQQGQTLAFDMAFLLTPVKPANTAEQFTNRYFHNGSHPAPVLSDLQTGIKITNVHHANAVNPYINYPFVATDTMKRFVDYWHQQGLKVKIYYTVRELSNQATELWALRSLGDEVLADGPGGGYPWLREHLVDHYNVQWFTAINGYEQADAAILTSGASRWYNYYIEGLQWLIKNEDIDGLYLDDVSYGRDMLKRMRRVMDAVKPGCLLDLHSNTGFSKGPANQYAEFFPYINKIWFGESFDYNHMSPANWLVEVSGIPFGLMGDMLHGGGNPWRGMVYGMTVRYPWYTEGVNCDPRQIWKIWDRFGIAGAQMYGYWETANPVTISDTAVLATAYVKPGKLLIAIGSWNNENSRINIKIDWARLGWETKERYMELPAINGFQAAGRIAAGDSITITPHRGFLIEINR